MSDPMRIRATLQGDTVDVKILMSHEMETGQRKDAAGLLIPAHFITRVTARCKDKVVITAEWGAAISKNPVFGFRFKGAAVGDKLSVTWVDNKLETRTDEVVIA
jgi:sulfur-oxidizing protein SoxZ